MQVNHFRILPRAEFIRIKACELSNGHSKANSSLIQTHEGTLGFNLVKKKKKKAPSSERVTCRSVAGLLCSEH